ncbi:MAG: D-alanyl-D-alanine carboxypeptidase [Proteobacteria bacterium]|nr:D-alanyl-D-alanine carboxypeptidase [Pseudomonadota bacterium]MBU1744825.1 D-alanyl-D-alanine carboxypeptidase [Pseudomonadota bacterium]
MSRKRRFLSLFIIGQWSISLINICFHVIKKTFRRTVPRDHRRLDRKMRLPCIICIIFTWFLSFSDLNRGALWAGNLSPSTKFGQKLAAMTGAGDAVVVAAPDGHILAGVNVDLALVPASILKLLTTLAALEKLGPDYRFRTDFYIDSQNNLKIKGYGDPLLVSEELKVMADHLAARLRTIHNLILDDFYFEQPVRIPGRGTSTEPYDAPNGALCANFNTVAFKRKNGRLVSDEPQTPLLPSVISKIAASGLTRGRITLAANSTEALQYTGELFQYFFRQAGMEVEGAIGRGRVDPQRDRLIWSYRSRHELRMVAADLLEYSNNFMANQVLLVMGAEVMGPPATVNKGLQALENYYRGDLKIESGRIVEASGISRQNRITARAMLKILQRYEPYHTLMRREGRQFYKTGHLKGIRTRAGFLTSAHGGLYRFVVMINTPGKTTDGMMKAIEEHLY